MVRMIFFSRSCPLCFTSGSIGAGALLSPLSATYFAQVSHWSYHYLVCFSIAFLNTILLVAVFRLKHQEGPYTVRHPGVDVEP